MSRILILLPLFATATLFTPSCKSSNHRLTPSSTTMHDDDDTHNSRDTVEASAPRRMSTNDGDGDVLGFLVALNEHEINAAMEAEKNDVSAEIMAYARMLHRDHEENLDQTRKLGRRINTTPVENSDCDQMRAKCSRELDMLSQLDGAEFGNAYIEAMINGHTEALQKIDRELLPSVDNDEVERHLKATRGHIAHHLEEAKKIRSSQRD